jgi:glucan endo-1,3-alpha-glucosidase
MRFTRTTLQWGLKSLLILTAACCPIGAHAQKTVFAHYMVTYQDYESDNGQNQELKIASYEREIRQAQAIGIDGFVLNAGGWLRQPTYIRNTAQMFEAAVRLNSGFKLMFSADICCGNGIDDVEDMMRRFAGNPHYAPVFFKHDGKFVLTTFVGDELGTAAWQQFRSDLQTGTNPSTAVEPTALPEASGAPSNQPLEIFFVPVFFWGGETPSLPDLQRGFDQWKSTIDGAFYWGIAGVPGSGDALDLITASDRWASVVHGGGKLYMAPVAIQFWGSNADRYYEYSGASGMRKLWMDAIQVTHPEWVEIITWNDFIEGTYVSPIDDPNKYPEANHLRLRGVPPGALNYFHSHAAVNALLPYFIQWYKTGVQPAITQDALYYFYRNQSKDFDAGLPPVENKYGPVADRIYVTANLTAPAILKVTCGGHTTVFHLPAGSTDVEAPATTGSKPQFELDRKGKTLLTGEGSDLIQAAPAFNNYYYVAGEISKHP